jgi:hypothetical protein
VLKIGDFARIGQVSIKALRHYDALGLLRPAHTPPRAAIASMTWLSSSLGRHRPNQKVEQYDRNHTFHRPSGPFRRQDELLSHPEPPHDPGQSGA